MKRNMITALLLLGFSLLIFNGCEKDYYDSPTNNTSVSESNSFLRVNLAAQYSLKSSDSIQAVNIDLQQISYHTSGDSTVSSGWIDVNTSPGIYNLMDYVSEDTLIAFDSLVAIQTISQVRLILGDSNTVMVDSVLYDLVTPSAQNSGIKIQVHTQLVPDSSYVIMLDFDPEQSIKQTGNGKYKLKPVIRAIVNP